MSEFLTACALRHWCAVSEYTLSFPSLLVIDNYQSILAITHVELDKTIRERENMFLKK